MGSSDTGHTLKNKHIRNKSASILLERDELREQYMNKEVANRSLELINKMIGSPLAAIEEAKQAEINPIIRSVSRLMKEANEARELCRAVLEKEEIDMEILYERLQEDIETHNALMEAELELEWEREKTKIMGMQNQAVLRAEKEKLEVMLKDSSEHQNKEKAEKAKTEKEHLAQMIAMLDLSLARRYENVRRMEAENAERLVRITELEKKLDAQYEAVSKRIDAVFGDLKLDKIYSFELPKLKPDEIAYLENKGEKFDSTMNVDGNDFLAYIGNEITHILEGPKENLFVELEEKARSFFHNLLEHKYEKLAPVTSEQRVAEEMESVGVKEQIRVMANDAVDKVANSDELQKYSGLLHEISNIKVEISEIREAFNHTDALIREEKEVIVAEEAKKNEITNVEVEIVGEESDYQQESIFNLDMNTEFDFDNIKADEFDLDDEMFNLAFNVDDKIEEPQHQESELTTASLIKGLNVINENIIEKSEKRKDIATSAQNIKEEPESEFKYNKSVVFPSLERPSLDRKSTLRRSSSTAPEEPNNPTNGMKNKI